MHAIESADLATPDGAPVAWMLRRQGVTTQARVSGPDLMLKYCARATEQGEAIFHCGSTEATLKALRQQLQTRWPALRIAGALSPPFRPPSAAECEAGVRAINASGARTVWVSLGSLRISW